MLEIDAHNYVLRAVNGKNDLLYAVRCCGALQHARDGRIRLWRSEASAAKALLAMTKNLKA